MEHGGNHYEILGLDARATPEQVERAYHFSLEMYSDGCVATYSLLSKDEVRRCRERIQQAYDVLSDPVRRHDYDVELGVSTSTHPVLPFPPVPSLRPSVAMEVVEEFVTDDVDGRLLPTVLPEPLAGADLKRFREARGITLRDIAEASKIGVRYLEYIESDRHAYLPAPVYLRGFLQEYAKAVGLDPRRTADAYMAHLPRVQG